MLHFVFLYLLVAATNAQVSDDVLCEGRVFEPLCTEGTIRIVSAAFGATDASFCGGTDNRPWSSNCQNDVSQSLISACQGKQTCSIPIQGSANCNGASRFLRVIWACNTGLFQSKSNDRGTDIVFSTAPGSRSTPASLHGKTVSGPIYVILSPPAGVQQVRFYLDDLSKVLSTETRAPFDLRGGLPWDTTTLANGHHRIVAAMTFSTAASGSTTGYVDAIFTIKNTNTGRASALNQMSDLFADTNSSTPLIQDGQTIPWALFGSACGLAVILAVVLIVTSHNRKGVERP